jgi:hypothetical protein
VWSQPGRGGPRGFGAAGRFDVRSKFARSRGAVPANEKTHAHGFADRHNANFVAKNFSPAAKISVNRFDLLRAVLITMNSSLKLSHSP